MKFIVTQTVYDTIPGANQKYYAVVDVEGLHAAAYGETEEALIAARHDPVLIRHVEFEEEDYEHPIYEMHHDIINDLRNVLLQLHLQDDNGVSAPLYSWKHYATELWEGTSLAAYAAERAAVEIPELEQFNLINEDYPVGDVGGETGYSVYERYDDGEDKYGCAASMTPQYLDVYKAEQMLAALNIAYILYRVAYRGIEIPAEGEADGCEVGFGDKTLFAEPESDWVIDYVRLEFATGDTWIEKVGAGWTEHLYFDLHIISDWPETGEGGYFDWVGTYYGEVRKWNREISICRLFSNLTSLPIVFETDWDLVAETVFEEDESNAMIL
jgi:hypothetical protein